MGVRVKGTPSIFSFSFRGQKPGTESDAFGLTGVVVASCIAGLVKAGVGGTSPRERSVDGASSLNDWRRTHLSCQQEVECRGTATSMPRLDQA